MKPNESRCNDLFLERVNCHPTEHPDSIPASTKSVNHVYA